MPRSAALAAAPDLKRDAVCWVSYWAAWSGCALLARMPRGHLVDQAGCAIHPAIAVYGHDHGVYWCVTNCVTITTYDHGLPGDPVGCLNRSKPLKCAGQGTVVIASGRRGRGFKSRHPDAKTAGQRLCAIKSRWPRVTNCVTIGSFSGGAA